MNHATLFLIRVILRHLGLFGQFPIQYSNVSKIQSIFKGYSRKSPNSEQKSDFRADESDLLKKTYKWASSLSLNMNCNMVMKLCAFGRTLCRKFGIFGRKLCIFGITFIYFL